MFQKNETQETTENRCKFIMSVKGPGAVLKCEKYVGVVKAEGLGLPEGWPKGGSRLTPVPTLYLLPHTYLVPTLIPRRFSQRYCPTWLPASRNFPFVPYKIKSFKPASRPFKSTLLFTALASA
ncbi:hypothetical protein AAG570_011451 [Ranatra chinensis]|uniref:Uncharacterized protein n=1 Tax=Ranatra chinensis TaxID=642074 RepID=A0ABD0YKN7_9HEMI